MITHILVAYDGSDQSERAFDFGLDLAVRYEARLLVLSVVRLPEPPVEVELAAMLENGNAYYAGRFEQLKVRAAQAGVALRCELKAGHPAEHITLLAENECVNHIVMGHRGQTMAQKWMIGSVCRQVINQAPCSVTVVR